MKNDRCQELQQQIEDLIVNDSSFRRLEELLFRFCPFEAMGAVNAELRHANFLAYLLDPLRPHNFGDGRSFRNRTDDLAAKHTCGRPENGPLQIQWNGEVVPCCYDYNNKIVLGNAFEQPILEILNNSKYRLLRDIHQYGKFGIFPYCDQCDQLLPHSDALVYSNRHSLPPEEAVKLSNTDLYDLVNDQEININNLSDRYR